MSVKRRDAGGDGGNAGERARTGVDPYRFVVIASRESAAWTPAFDRRPGVLVLDPMRAPDAELIGPLQPPDDGPEDTAVPRWAVYDCAEVPGAVLGILRAPIESQFDRPLDPLSLVLATPHAEAGAWHLYGMTVRSTVGPVDEIRRRTIDVAMDLLLADRATLIVPWASPLLERLATTATVEVLSAQTPLHGPRPAATLMISRAPGGGPQAAGRAVFHVPDADGLAPMLGRLQDSLEAGRRFLLTPAGSEDPPGPGRTRLALREVAP